ncbi:MAG TPA: hypothetical protein PLT86_12780 [Candidatus Latescibacteria bacterium]|nr:hypothetical protein [Candidatus Latescibacterota bacterium]
MMSCHEVQSLLDDFGRGAIRENEAGQLSIHLRECAECRAEFELESRLVRIGANAPVFAPPADFAAKVVAEWQRVAAVETVTPWEILKNALSEVFRAASDPILQPLLLVRCEIDETLANARQTLCKASEIVSMTLKQVFFGRFVPENK